ncbi:hypothetical protein C8Q80DRAFT_1079609, partial [Daedaleopsis nitida]
RMYIGEVLDIYKKSSGRHGSVETATSCTGLSHISLRVYLPLTVDEGERSDSDDGNEAMLPAPNFSCRYGAGNLYTHAPARQLLYHLGPSALTGPPGNASLKAESASRW